LQTSSLKDAVRVLNTTFSAQAVPHPLPEDLQHAIEVFLESQEQIEEHDAQKLQEDLLFIFNKYVASNQEKHAPFVSALRLLRPAIHGEARLDEWWSLVIRPTIDAVGYRQHAVEDAREFLLGVLVFDPEDDISGEKSTISKQFTSKLLDAYLARTRLPSGDDVVSPEDEFIAHELENILVAFGRKQPKVS
jgi:hypothetical protein